MTSKFGNFSPPILANKRIKEFWIRRSNPIYISGERRQVSYV